MQNDSTKNPTPAPGQIWRWDGKRKGEPVIVDRIDGETLWWAHGGHDRVSEVPKNYVCIGVETPAGRVMVGERRRIGAALIVFVLDRVVDGLKFIVRNLAGVEQIGGWDASEIAQYWPLVTEEWAWMPGTASEEAIGEIRAVMDKWRNGGAAILPLGVSFAHLPPMSQEQIDALADRLGLKMADPRAEREQRRREIDAVVREDARKFPAFATARRAAVMAWHEVDPSGTAHLADALLSAIHLYEGTRGGGRRPATDVQWNSARDRAALAAYERARGLP